MSAIPVHHASQVVITPSPVGPQPAWIVTAYFDDARSYSTTYCHTKEQINAAVDKALGFPSITPAVKS